MCKTSAKTEIKIYFSKKIIELDPVIRCEGTVNTECFMNDDMLLVNLFSASKGCFPFIMLLTAMYASFSGVMTRKNINTNTQLNYSWSQQTQNKKKKCYTKTFFDRNNCMWTSS